MGNPQVTQEDEIDLREYIKVIIKRKKFILSFFSIAIILAAIIVSVTPKTYKATATIMITPSAIQSVFSPIKELGGGNAGDKASPWDISIATHVNLLKSNLVLERTIEKLNLKDRSGREMAIEDLARKLSIKKAIGESVIELEATDVDPQEASNIVNAWAEQYVEYSQELVMGEINGIGDFVMTQFEASQKDLLKAEEAVKDFRKSNKLDLMGAELRMKKGKLNGYKNELDGTGLAIKTNEETLHGLKEQIAKQKKYIILSKAITDDALWQMSSKEDGLSGLDKKGLRSEDINPIYQDLETRIVNGEIEVNTLKAREELLNKSIGSLIGETKELDDDILQKNFDLVQLTRQVSIFKRSYDDFSNKIQESRMTKEAQFGEVKIVSPASLPSYPIGGKMKKIFLAGIISLIGGLFLTFFVEFWQKGQ